MQIVAAIVLAAVVFIGANHYVTRFGLLWWVAHTLVFALVLAFVWLVASMLFAPSGPPASDVGPPANQSAASQPER
jgi:heme A synthase